MVNPGMAMTGSLLTLGRMDITVLIVVVTYCENICDELRHLLGTVPS